MMENRLLVWYNYFEKSELNTARHVSSAMIIERIQPSAEMIFYFMTLIKLPVKIQNVHHALVVTFVNSSIVLYFMKLLAS